MESILFESNLESAIDAARALVVSQGCKSIKQQTSIDYDKLFKDGDFETSEQSIHRPGDIPKSKMLTFENKLRSIEWFRPQQIAPDYDLVGFMKSAKLQNLANLDEAGELTDEQLCDGQRIY